VAKWGCNSWVMHGVLVQCWSVSRTTVTRGGLWRA